MDFSAQDIVLIIGAVTTMVCSIVAALKSSKSVHHSAAARYESAEANMKLDIKSEAITGKLDNIESQTNGNVQELRVKLRAANDTNNHLVDVITCLVDMLPEGSLTKARQELERLKSSLGHRRISDQVLDGDFSRQNLESK